MARTVVLTSRTFSSTAKLIEVRCDFVTVHRRPDAVPHNAGGNVQRSLLPLAINLVNVQPDDRVVL